MKYSPIPLFQTVPVIAITGGTTAGKSSIMVHVREDLPRYGFRPYIVGEVATTLFEAGVTHEEVPITQELIMRKMIADEEILKTAARYYNGPLRPVVICDRGIIDAKVYCKPGEFDAILKLIGITERQAKDRYNAVIHLVTTAIGAEDVFKRVFKDNPHRVEKGIEEARIKDGITQAGWIGAHNFKTIPNSGSFEDKKNATIAQILKELGAPVPQPHQKKFLVPGWFETSSIPSVHETVETIQWYLHTTPKRESMNYPNNADRIVERIREVQDHGSTSYWYTLKAFVPGENDPYVLGDLITEIEYKQLKRYCIGEPVKKKRTYFIYENQYFQIDEFSKPINDRGDMLLEIVPTNLAPNVSIPPFIPEAVDVTSDLDYHNDQIAHRIAHE